MKEPLRDRERLLHIEDAIQSIKEASEGLTMEVLSENKVLRHALTWNIMVIGEAANKLTPSFCDAHPKTPWKQIAGMRHVLVHDYYQIDEEELYYVIIEDIPVLRAQIQQYIEEELIIEQNETLKS